MLFFMKNYKLWLILSSKYINLSDILKNLKNKTAKILNSKIFKF